MKNFRVIAPVLVCLMFTFYVVGCGSAASSGGGGGTNISGKLSDPYISHATLVEKNQYGSIEAGMICTTEDNGSFTFPGALTAGDTIEMLTSGTHLGTGYTGALMKRTVASGLNNITPLTEWGTHGITDGAIAAMITSAGITVDSSFVGLDPMVDLSTTTTFDAAGINAVKGIKSAIYAYSVSRIAIDYYGANYTEADLSTPFMGTVEAAIATAVNDGISDTILIGINNQIDQVNISIESLAGGSKAYDVPHATADQISRSAFNIADYVAYMKINNSPGGAHSYNWVVPSALIPRWGQGLGMRYYFRDNYNSGASIPGGPYAGMKATQVALLVGNIKDTWGNSITSTEVDPATINGYRIKTTDGSIESF